MPPNGYPTIVDENDLDNNNQYDDIILDEEGNYLFFEFGEVWQLLGPKNIAQAVLDRDFPSEDNKEYIEFGSYPSPEIPNIENQLVDSVLNNFSIKIYDSSNLVEYEVSKLYSFKVVNNFLFKPGEYVQFIQPVDPNTNLPYPIDTSNISYQIYQGGVYQETIKKIYKIRLLLQLPNGFIDFTDNV